MNDNEGVLGEGVAGANTDSALFVLFSDSGLPWLSWDCNSAICFRISALL